MSPSDPNRHPSPVNAANDASLHFALFNLLPSSVVLLDLGGWVRDVKPAFCRLMGFTREELVGSHVSRFSANSPHMIEANLARLRHGEMLEHEVINRQRTVRFAKYPSSRNAPPISRSRCWPTPAAVASLTDPSTSRRCWPRRSRPSSLPFRATSRCSSNRAPRCQS